MRRSMATLRPTRKPSPTVCMKRIVGYAHSELDSRTHAPNALFSSDASNGIMDGRATSSGQILRDAPRCLPKGCASILGALRSPSSDMSPLQVRTIALCAIVIVLDGFDTQCMGFLVPVV